MNEQLVVKNFGPITDATVDFKRVTLFIGPTGGGKSTLAKLAALFRNSKGAEGALALSALGDFGLRDYWDEDSQVDWYQPGFLTRPATGAEMAEPDTLDALAETGATSVSTLRVRKVHSWLSEKATTDLTLRKERVRKLLALLDEDDFEDALISGNFQEIVRAAATHYVPSERTFSSAIEYSKDGLMRDDIGLPKTVLDFNNSFSLAKKEIVSKGHSEIALPFFNAEYWHREGHDFIKTTGSKKLIRLSETASGIQSVVPLLVLLEYLSRHTEQAQSFIIEEPELNLYPAAQQGLLNWLVEKCTKGTNDLTITTHSPYLLSHLNLLLYAYQVGHKDEAQRAKVKALVPEESWINPAEFAAYYVNGPAGADGIRSLVDEETNLIAQNGLDTVSGTQADLFDQLLDINSGF